MPAEEILVDFTAARDRPASQVRSTLITTSIQALRAHGRFETYERALPPELPELKEKILTVVAGIWLPIEIAIAHYEACETLELSPPEQ